MIMEKSLRLHFNIEKAQLRLVKTSCVDSHPPRGDAEPFEPIAAGIIGHWIEIRRSQGDTVYRRFLQNLLPLNYFQQCFQPRFQPCSQPYFQQWNGQDEAKTRPKIARKKRSFNLDIPVTEGSYELLIYEQSLPAPDTKQTRRQLHMKIDLGKEISEKYRQSTSRPENVF